MLPAFVSADTGFVSRLKPMYAKATANRIAMEINRAFGPGDKRRAILENILGGFLSYYAQLPGF